MKPLSIGTSSEGSLDVDLAKLVDTRALIQANSGGGKSWLMRLLAEKAIPQVQTIILDPEGEFASLREKHDLVLVGREGEVQANPRGAGMLARKLAELQVSCVIDLYDLPIPDRRRYVRLFLEDLIAIPKNLYHPILIILDEGHMFCPERSAGEAESTQAVINLLSLGRKRGMCGILATQRLSKLHKDAEAECNNVFIGRTVQDIDQDRAAKVLGFKNADRTLLRDLDHEFFTFGPAIITPGVTRFTPSMVETTHPKAGQRHKLSAPKASDAVRDLVTHLADLPQQAEEEAKTLAEAKKQIAELKRQVRQTPAVKAVPAVEKRVEVPVLKGAQLLRLEKVVEKFNATGGMAQAAGAEIAAAIKSFASKTIPYSSPAPSTAVPPPHSPRPAVGKTKSSEKVVTCTGGLRRMMIALAQRPQGLKSNQLALRAGMAVSGGSFGTYLSRGRTQGWIVGDGDLSRITADGIAALGSYEPLPSGRALLDYWLADLGKGGEARMLKALAAVYPGSMDKQQLAGNADIAFSGGSFGTYLSRLRTLELVEGKDDLRASAELFEK